MTEHPFLARLAEAGRYEPPARPVNGRPPTTGVPSPPAAGDPQAVSYAANALTRGVSALRSSPKASATTG